VEAKRAYVGRLAAEVASLECLAGKLDTVYFGGGSPALCDLEPVLAALRPRLDSSSEFTVELHPLDVSGDLLRRLKDGGVNRISMGVQSLDDGILADMGRGYGFGDAERAFAEVKRHFDNAGIDLIVGYPGETSALTPRHARLAKWGLRHCSVYSLMVEEKTRLWRAVLENRVEVPDDETVMDRLRVIAAFLGDISLERYEISNYAVRGSECRHNLAVWRGEDYVGLGEGASGRMGLLRTENYRFAGERVEEVSPERDARERTMFSLRTRDGLDACGFPQWSAALDRFAAEGLLEKDGSVYRLTGRGMEVCDTILAEIVL
jgi:oxygen-independent coproporphyrinogen-3 oxidase